MTKAEFTRNGSAWTVSITGHAMFAPEGLPDIVCAACSTLTYVLINQLLKAESEGKLIHMHQETDSAAGDFTAEFEAQESARDEITKVIDVITDGFALLADGYPENVKLKWGEK